MSGLLIIILILILLLVLTDLFKTKSKKIKLERKLHSYKHFEKSEAYEAYLERLRQIEKENYSIKDDKEFNNMGELIGGSAGYLESYLNNIENSTGKHFKFLHHTASIYPWMEDKREQTPQRRKLIIAIGLILAELDRIKN